MAIDPNDYPKHLGSTVIINPECRDGKHTSCNNTGWDLSFDTFTACPCPCHLPLKDGCE